MKDIGNIDVFNVQSRIKTLESANSKSKRLNINITELDDLAGLRIIVGTQNELPVIERFFTRQEYGNDLTIIKRNDYKRKTGYRSVHLVVEMKSHYQQSIHPGRVEVQLQTIFGAAFNYLSRAWRYKASFNMDSAWNERFLDLSNTLNNLENIADELHSKVVEGLSVDSSSPLTPHTFRVIANQIFSESINFDDAIDYCRWYAGFGCKTNGHLREFLITRKLIAYITSF